MDARQDRTALRLQLFHNGFTPLPNRNKMSLLKGWSTIKVDEEMIESAEWSRSRRLLDTGLRCGDIIALDWDIDDKALLNQLLDEVVEQGLVEESPFVRIGKAPREMWIYRTPDKIGKRTTGHFAPKGTPLDESGYAVEILGNGCQFAAYGQRDDSTAYAWPVEDLLDHAYMDLPVITLPQCDALKDYCVAFFERHGLERRSPGGGTDKGYTHVYDLEPDMVFDVKDMGPLSVAEIAEVLRVNKDEVLRCSVEALRPTSGSWAGMASLADGNVCISDHGTYTSHFPLEADTARSLALLGALLRQRFGDAAGPPAKDSRLAVSTELLDTRRPLDDNLKIALQRYVYLEFDNMVCDLANPALLMTPDHFRTMMAQYYEERPGPQGKLRVERAGELFIQHRDRRNAMSQALRPDRPWPLYVEDDGLHINTYAPVRLPTDGDAAPGFAFMAQLLPLEAERRYFLQWLAFKVLNPQVRGPGVVMVAHESYGTGRGALIKLLRAIFGTRLVGEVSFDMLAGRNYQSQYNEWLADNLIVAVNEAQETSSVMSRWHVRNNAYERLKEVIDPGSHDIQVVRKGSSNTAGRTYASVLVMTNHMDSFVLPAGDRRLAVLENGRPMPPEYWMAFYAWMAEPGNVGAFVEQLLALDLSGYNPFAAPPMTAAKADMIDASQSDLDRIMAAVMAQFEDTLLVKEQVFLRIEDHLANSNADIPDDWQRVVERLFIRSTRKLVGVDDQVRIEDKVRTVRVAGQVNPDIVHSNTLMIEEVLRNGPLVRPMLTTGRVIQFRRQ